MTQSSVTNTANEVHPHFYFSNRLQITDALQRAVLVMQMALLALIGFLAGVPLTRMICGWADEQSVFRSPVCDCGATWSAVNILVPFRRCRKCAQQGPYWLTFTPLFTAGLFCFAWYQVFENTCHALPEVAPDPFWIHGRFVFHLVFIALLILATGTDLRDYVIPDQITLPGIFLGLTVATLSGDVQIMHVWVDWSDAVNGLRGAWIPDWIKQHHHWHGLAWSTAGLVCGAGVTWTIRVVSGLILGQPALGFGDVTLMAMVGSFLGWQPVLFVFLVAPACALVFGMLIRLITGRSYVAFGPYLCGGALIVLLTWKWLWTPTRDVFGHWPSLLQLAGVALGTLVVLLVLVRIFRAIPVRP